MKNSGKRKRKQLLPRPRLLQPLTEGPKSVMQSDLSRGDDRRFATFYQLNEMIMYASLPRSLQHTFSVSIQTKFCLQEKPDSGEEEKVYCICNRPDDGKSEFIHCDACGHWFHPDCVGTSLEVRERHPVHCNNHTTLSYSFQTLFCQLSARPEVLH